MISVVVPLYNKESSVSQTLQTVLNQSYQDFEIVIVNDGSTDRSVEEAEKVKDNRIRIIHQSNSGVSAARNKGIVEAKGEYIAFLDADDEWDKDYLLTQYTLTQKYPECIVFACNYEFKDSQGKVSKTILHKIPFVTSDGLLANYFEVASNSHPPLWTSAVMVSRNALLSVGGFPVGIRSGEDLLTWARLVVCYSIAFSRKSVACYHLGEGYDYDKLPPRRQDAGDPVGKALKDLYKQHPNIKGFRSYIGHWHKMRASVAIRYGERCETLKESAYSLFYNPFNYKVIPFMVLALLPAQLRKKIISNYKGA